MTDSKMNCGDQILVELVRATAARGIDSPVEEARAIFSFMEALEAEASILSLRNERDAVADVAGEISALLVRRQFKQASAVAVAYGSGLGRTPHQCVRPFSLRAAQVANSVSPAEMNVENGTAFCALLAELGEVLERQVEVETRRQGERGAGR